MITNSDKLEIFENFISLPKKMDDERISGSLTAGGSLNLSAISNGVAREESLHETIEMRAATYFHYIHMHERSLKSWIKLKAAEWLFPEKKVRKIRYQSVDEFFNEVKGAIKELEINPKAIEFYTNAIETAKENGQIALLEVLRDKKGGVLKESKLLESGEIQYVTEEDIVNFYKKSNLRNKMLKLTWIKNYARMIPQDVIEKKKIYDSTEIFDNYVILHFDKYDNSTEMTKEEKEKAKDPILFGVLKGTRKLYYIGDWIDEYCDLTLDKFLSTLEMEESRKLTKETIEESIKK
jgi:hypothetical protein